MTDTLERKLSTSAAAIAIRERRRVDDRVESMRRRRDFIPGRAWEGFDGPRIVLRGREQHLEEGELEVLCARRGTLAVELRELLGIVPKFTPAARFLSATRTGLGRKPRGDVGVPHNYPKKK